MNSPPLPSSSGALTLARLRRMKTFGRSAVLWSVVLYIVGQMVVNAILDRWRPRIGEKLPQQVWRQKRKRLWELGASQPDRSMLVMVGSSRTEGAFMAGNVTKLAGPGQTPLLAYNCGVPASGPLHELLFLREMIDAGLRPRLLVVEFLPPLLNKPQRGLTSEESWLQPAELSARELVRLWPYLAKQGNARRQWLQACVAPCYARRNDLHTDLRQRLSIDPLGPNRPHRESGELTEWPPPEIWPRRRQVAFEMYHESLKRFQMGDGPRRAMRDLLECCRKEQIPVAFVLMPESAEFRKWYIPEGIAETKQLLADLQDKYSVPTIDATQWVADEDFFDGHHVLPKGAQVFTHRLIEELRPILDGRERKMVRRVGFDS